MTTFVTKREIIDENRPNTLHADYNEVSFLLGLLIPNSDQFWAKGPKIKLYAHLAGTMILKHCKYISDIRILCKY